MAGTRSAPWITSPAPWQVSDRRARPGPLSQGGWKQPKGRHQHGSCFPRHQIPPPCLASSLCAVLREGCQGLASLLCVYCSVWPAVVFLAPCRCAESFGVLVNCSESCVPSPYGRCLEQVIVLTKHSCEHQGDKYSLYVCVVSCWFSSAWGSRRVLLG